MKRGMAESEILYMAGSGSDTLYPRICLERLARTTEDLKKVFDCDL
jgi:hypothetical protein